MPLYDRKCNACDAIFEVVCEISEKENKHECPECDSVDGYWHLGAPAVAKRKSVKISPRWLRMSLMYQHFSRDWSHLCDYSRQAQEDAYLFDSLGQRPPPRDQINGFIIGKQWMGVTVDMWKEDLPKGLILRRELYEDPNYPHWWLDQVLPPLVAGPGVATITPSIRGKTRPPPANDPTSVRKSKEKWEEQFEPATQTTLEDFFS